MSLTETILTDPTLFPILIAILYALKYWQRGLGWYDYRTIHGLKVRLAPRLDRWIFAVSRKGYREGDPEFLTTVDQPVKRVWKRMVASGGSPHLVNSVKRRETPEGRVEYSKAHAVWYHGDGSQTEAYLFANANGTTDVYAHHEEVFTDADDHLDGDLVTGDPKGVVIGSLG